MNTRFRNALSASFTAAFLMAALATMSGCPGMNPPDLDSNPFRPRPGDALLQRAGAEVDRVTSLLALSDPPRVSLRLEGTLPTPCHQLRVVPIVDTPAREIRLEVYSLVDPDQVCIQVLAPFDGSLLYSELAAGDWTVIVNGRIRTTFRI